ncbi:MAG: TlpA disulfide reductase family protein [Ginsengibacter sp.]|jgi:thiol-disulfide isomerase/thioredoxin
MSPIKIKLFVALILLVIFNLNMCTAQRVYVDPNQQIENEIAGKKIVVLNFWSIFCLPCLKELPAISNLYNSYRDDKNISIYTIALNSGDELNQFFSGDTTNIYGKIYKKLNLKITFPIITYNIHNNDFNYKLNAISTNVKNDSALSLLYSKFHLVGIPTTIIFFKGKEYKRFIGFEGDEVQYQKKISENLSYLSNYNNGN